jgi:hypothetical protein
VKTVDKDKATLLAKQEMEGVGTKLKLSIPSKSISARATTGESRIRNYRSGKGLKQFDIFLEKLIDQVSDFRVIFHGDPFELPVNFGIEIYRKVQRRLIP